MIPAALHLAAAALICVLAGQTTSPLVLGALLLALAPDLDTPKSLIGALVAPLSRRIERAIGHRTATHSLLALALVSVAAYLLVPVAWGVLAGSYASHLALDLLIGVQGIRLFWPAREWFTLAAWRDDGLAPRALLVALLLAVAGVALWPSLAPGLSPQVSAALNPIATPKPSASPRPAITIRFDLPAGVPLSALRVRSGDVLREGQILAAWERPTPSPWPSPTAPALPPTPAALPAPLADSSAARGVAEAQAALAALTTAQAAERAALLVEQQRQIADLQRALADAQRALDALQPAHERAQQEHQHAVDAAATELADARAAASLADPADALATQRAADRVHAAEAQLREALDAQDRMRTAQGIERQQAEAAVTQAQAELDALPAQQRQALSKLDADQRAAKILALSRVESARGQAADARRVIEHDAAIVDATSTTAAQAWQDQVTATAQAHAEAVAATAAAIPTLAPNQVISRASGRIVAVSAEEKEGQLVVSLELVP